MGKPGYSHWVVLARLVRNRNLAPVAIVAGPLDSEHVQWVSLITPREMIPT
jgi:hypothetical protein